jgi:hypothetical protein
VVMARVAGPLDTARFMLPRLNSEMTWRSARDFQVHSAFRKQRSRPRHIPARAPLGENRPETDLLGTP